MEQYEEATPCSYIIPRAVFESLSDAKIDMYKHLKTAHLARLSPNMTEERLRTKPQKVFGG